MPAGHEAPHQPEAAITEGVRASIGSTVAYVSREAFIRASETGDPADPSAAIVSRVELDKERRATGKVTLHVLDPEAPNGIRVERSVEVFDGSGPGYRTLPVRIDLQELATLIDSRVQFVASGVGAGGVGEEAEEQLVKLIDARIEHVLSAPPETKPEIEEKK